MRAKADRTSFKPSILSWIAGFDHFRVMLVGEGADRWGDELKCPVWRHGLVSNDGSLADVYNAADILVHPATMENLPNSVLEAQACGLPAVAFDSGGVKDLVVHKKTGYLAPIGNTEDLIQGILWLLESDEHRESCSIECRRRALDSFTAERQSLAFFSLYSDLLQGDAL